MHDRQAMERRRRRIGLSIFGGGVLAWLALMALMASAVFAGGCAVTEATWQGHDLLDSGLAEIRTGLDEYHADDAERMRTYRAGLAGAFAQDVAAAAGQDDAKTAVATVTAQFLAHLENTEQAESVEEQRYAALCDNIEALLEVNGSMRDLNQIKAGWQSEAVEYANKLRDKLIQAQD